MVKYTKKNTEVKNSQYKYGELGERYVARNIRCPRCSSALKKLTAGAAAMDFHCQGRTTHWYQLKTYQASRLKVHPDEVWQMHCGQYDLQQEAFFGAGYHTDMLILRYNPRKHQVCSLHWHGNEKIHPRNFRMSLRNEKTYSRANGMKRETGTVQRRHSILRIEYAQTIPLPIVNNTLPHDFTYDVKERAKTSEKTPVPAWEFMIGTYKVSLRDRKCTCRQAHCEHQAEAWGEFLVNPNHRQYKGSRGELYAVDVENWTCSCPQYRYRAEFCVCKHLQDASKTPAVPFTPTPPPQQAPQSLRAPRAHSQPVHSRELGNFRVRLHVPGPVRDLRQVPDHGDFRVRIPS